MTSPYIDTIESPHPGELGRLTIKRRLVQGGWRLVGHIVTRVYDESILKERRCAGLPDSSQEGTISASTWDCQCGATSRRLFARPHWARRALINHQARMHGPAAMKRLFGIEPDALSRM